MNSPYQIVRDLEAALCEYTGATHAITVNSCTMALLLAVKYCVRPRGEYPAHQRVTVPKRTYVGVPMSVINAGCRVRFEAVEWQGCYQLAPLPVWDSARAFTFGMFAAFPADAMVCCSFHATKILGDTQGGCILLGSGRKAQNIARWLKRMRFDGRDEGVPITNETVHEIGYHCYMSPDVAARLLFRLHSLPKHNPPLPNDDYPDLSEFEVFKWQTNSTTSR